MTSRSHAVLHEAFNLCLFGEYVAVHAHAVDLYLSVGSRPQMFFSAIAGIQLQ